MFVPHEGRVEVFDGRRLLQFRYDAGAIADDRAKIRDILWLLHERQRDPIHAQFERVGEIGAILGR